MYSSFVQQALSQSIMSAGGLGIAAEMARAVDPSLGTVTGQAGSSPSGGATT
jgi:Rod binding domain-containing protein